MLETKDKDAAFNVNAATLRLYKVARVEKANPPDGATGRNWHRYTLESGRSTITGHRQGSHKDVLAYATLCAEQLNVRGTTAQSIWSPRGRKPANTKPADPR